MQTQWGMIRVIAAAALLFAVCGCGDDDDAATEDAGTDAGDTDDAYDGALTSFEGIAIDNIADDEPVAGATVIVDTGWEVITTETAGDGSFTVDEVPAEAPITITVLAEDRQAISIANVMVDEEAQPVLFTLPYRSMDDYGFPVINVSGTVDNLPVDATFVCFYGADQFGQSCTAIPSAGDFTFDFDLTVAGGVETVSFTVAALDGTTAEVFAVEVVTVDTDADQDVAVTLPDTAPITLTVSTNTPLLDGTEFANQDDSMIHNASMTYLAEVVDPVFGGFPLTGFATGIEAAGDGFDVTVPYFPQADYQNMVKVILSEDMANGSWTMANEPIEEGAETVDIEVLDSPTLLTHDTFKPGSTVAWEPVDGSIDYLLLVFEGEEVAWALVTRATEIAFPAFPDGFDQGQLFASGNWDVRARDGNADWTNMDWDEADPFRFGCSIGGWVAWE
jgi:hypothetical protein